MARIHVVHLITGLSVGGAEAMLVKLLSRGDRDRFDTTVVSLLAPGPMADQIRALGVNIHTLGMRRGSLNPLAILRLVKLLRGLRSDLLQTWMYHSDLFGGLAAWLAGGLPVVWGIRNGPFHPTQTKRSTLWVVKTCALLSHSLPRSIVVNSHSSRFMHAELGYCAEKMVVIPNGFDLLRFRPDALLRNTVRAELGLGSEAFVIGLVARFDPQKDHHTFIRAAAGLAAKNRSVEFVLCGEGVSNENPHLRAWIHETRYAQRFHLLGNREDIHRVMNSFDIASLSSMGESFPNALGEAMACGIPCVTTDVGDAAKILGEAGILVPACEPEALSSAWEEVISLSPEDRNQLGLAGQQRVRENYDLPRVVRGYENLYDRHVRDSEHS